MDVTRILLGESDRRVRAVGRHVDVLHLYDESGFGGRLRFDDHLCTFGIIGHGLAALVPLLFGGVAQQIDERVLSVDAQFGVALQRNPVAHVSNPVPRENCRSPARKAPRERASQWARVDDAETLRPHTARVRLSTSSLIKMCFTWVFTVSGAMRRSRAISLLD
jgi:hypothetical protein